MYKTASVLHFHVLHFRVMLFHVRQFQSGNFISYNSMSVIFSAPAACYRLRSTDSKTGRTHCSTNNGHFEQLVHRLYISYFPAFLGF